MSENQPKQYELYGFMNDERFKGLNTAIEYVDFFLTVKQDCLIKLDATELALANAKINLEIQKSEILLETNFKSLYGKDNESVRNSYIMQECEELFWQIKDYQIDKKELLNQINILDGMIEANMLLVNQQCDCDCNCGE